MLTNNSIREGENILKELEEKSQALINEINMKNELDFALITRIEEVLLLYRESINYETLGLGQFITSNHATLAIAYTKVFTVPVMLINHTGVVTNASGVLLSLDKKFLITNFHVYEEWKRLNVQSETLFQIGSVSIPVDELKIDFNKSLDLITIRITEDIIQKISRVSPKKAFSSNDWHTEVELGTTVIASGFPGKLREDEVEFSNLNYGAIAENITELTESKLIIPFDRKQWEKVLGINDVSQLTSLGGFSGGPVFAFTEKDITVVGIVFEDGGNFFDGVRVVRSRVINRDGTIDIEWGY